MRHAAAALLNAASGGVDYPISTAEVIARFQAAFDAGTNSAYQAQKNEFEDFNRLGCPLN